MGGAALAEALLADRQNELLGLRKGVEPLLRQLDLRPLDGVGAVRLDPFGVAQLVDPLQIGHALLRRGIAVLEDRHRDDPVFPGQADAAHAGGGPAAEHPDLGQREADAHAEAGGEQNVAVLGRRAHADQAVAVVQLHRDLAVAVDAGEVGQAVAPDIAAGGGEQDEQIRPGLLVLGQRRHRGDRLAGGERQQVDQRPAPRLRRADRQAVDLHLVGDAAAGKEQHRRVGVGDEQVGDEILLLRRHAGAALAAAALRPVGRQRHPLDVAAVADRDDHVLALDQRLDVGFELAVLDLGPPRRAEPLPDLQQFGAQDAEQLFATAKDLQVLGDPGDHLAQVVADLVALQAGQPVQAQVEDGARLGLRQPVGFAFAERPVGLVDQGDQGRHVAGRPVLGHQLLARRLRVGGAADQLDHVVQIGDGDAETEQHVRPLPRAVQLEDRAAGDDLLAERQEGFEDLLKVQQLRPSAVERQHVDAERGLKRRVAVELVQHDIGVGIAAQLDDHADAVAVAFVAQVRDALDRLVLDDLGDPLQQPRLVDLVGDLVDDDRVAILADLLDLRPAAHDDAAAAGVIGGADAGPAQDHRPGRKVRPGHDLHQRIDRDVGVVDDGAAGVDDLLQVMGRDVRRHADGDAAGTVDQQVGVARRQDHRLFGAVVVVRLEIDGVLVDVLQQRLARLGQPRLGIALGGRRIAVHRAVVALAVDQHQPHREVLRHAHHGVVDRLAAMGMVPAHHVADDARRLLERFRRIEAVFLHGVEDSPVHRLQPVPNVGQRPADDDAHGVVEVGALHLLLDRHGRDIESRRDGRRIDQRQVSGLRAACVCARQSDAARRRRCHANDPGV